MYIRKTTIKTKKNGQTYHTYRLVESVRTEKVVSQRTLINLGKNFPYPEELWPVLAGRIQDIVYGQKTLIPLPMELEEGAQRYAALLIQTRGQNIQDDAAAIEDYQEVDLNSLEMTRPRSVGCEHAALSAANQLQLKEILASLGLTTPQIAAALGAVIGRMCNPGSELAIHNWLQNRSALGELLDYDYGNLSLTRMYQISDLLLKHKKTLEDALFAKQCAMFGLTETITLYDLTNTYFEGGGQANDLASYGRSKEKRSDCPLVTLALVLDSSGFPKRSEVFAGNISEPGSLAEMLRRLEQPAATGILPQIKPTIVMDAGIATQDNIDWLKEKGYKYLVVSRKRHREFSPDDAVLVREDKAGTVRVQKVINAAGEVELYCHSSLREQKETAINNLFMKRLEEALQKLSLGLTKKGCIKKYDKVMEQIGRLKEKYSVAAKSYQITVAKDEKSGHATLLTWVRNCPENTADAHPGVYCLRSNQDTWDEATLWRTYTMLTELESVFRSLKSELGLRPVFHQTTDRVKSHLFITVLAYHLVHTLRFQLKRKGINDSWASLRKTLSAQHRITASMKCRNSEIVHVRKSTRPEPAQQIIYDALTLAHFPGKTIKLRE
jgi:transposase